MADPSPSLLEGRVDICYENETANYETILVRHQFYLEVTYTSTRSIQKCRLLLLSSLSTTDIFYRWSFRFKYITSHQRIICYATLDKHLHSTDASAKNRVFGEKRLNSCKTAKTETNNEGWNKVKAQNMRLSLPSWLLPFLIYIGVSTWNHHCQNIALKNYCLLRYTLHSYHHSNRTATQVFTIYILYKFFQKKFKLSSCKIINDHTNRLERSLLRNVITFSTKLLQRTVSLRDELLKNILIDE